MQITVRTLLASVTATAVLGGAVGALATAATTTSQASPQAIAAAVQKVQDQAAERYLRTIVVQLLPLNSLEGTLNNIRKNTYNVCWDTASSLQRPSCEP